eukprot:scaffold392_cov234-Pinguiococcus_pyrenoidosus.AAC.2
MTDAVSVQLAAEAVLQQQAGTGRCMQARMDWTACSLRSRNDFKLSPTRIGRCNPLKGSRPNFDQQDARKIRDSFCDNWYIFERML